MKNVIALASDIGIAAVHALANTFTLVIVVLIVTLVIFGQTGDAWFLASTISLNTIIAIIQEVRAKQALRQLELLHAPQARIIRGEHRHLIPINHLQVGDHLFLQAGDQVPADGQLLQTEHFSVNQALLTGESSEVSLYKSDLAYAGSFAITGTAVMRVTATGQYTRAGQMSAKLKWYQSKLTPLQQSFSRLIRYLTYLAILLGVAIYLNGLRIELPFTNIISNIASGAISVVPEGLILASTVLYSYAAMQMVRQRVLIQRITAVEGFSRLDYLCLDKTGTLTNNQQTLTEIKTLPDYNEEQVRHFLSGFVQGRRTFSSTMQAIRHYLKPAPQAVYEEMPFSSTHKFSAVLIKDGSIRRVIALGAPEVISRSAPLTPDQETYIEKQAQSGLRVLLMADFGPTLDVLAPTLKRRATAVAIISLQPVIRPGTEDTIFYLQAQGIQLKIISGDAPGTVQSIARTVGVLHWRKVLNGDQLSQLTPKEWEEKIPETTIFARVLPEQKERIVSILQEHGFTGMVGDGVNDTLALKKADLSIALADGSQAARQVADVVLLNNSFNAVPLGLRLGSQVILSLEMISCLFFNKIIAGATVLIVSLILGSPYPFSTRHLLLLNIFTVGLPTLLWSLAPARASGRLAATGLLQRVLRLTLPTGMITGLAAVTTYQTLWIGTKNSGTASTAAFFVTLFLGIMTFWIIPRYLRAVQNYSVRWWPWLYSAGAIIVVIFSSQSGALDELFTLYKLNWLAWGYSILISLLASLALWHLVNHKKQYVAPSPTT